MSIASKVRFAFTSHLGLSGTGERIRRNKRAGMPEAPIM